MVKFINPALLYCNVYIGYAWYALYYTLFVALTPAAWREFYFV